MPDGPLRSITTRFELLPPLRTPTLTQTLAILWRSFANWTNRVLVASRAIWTDGSDRASDRWPIFFRPKRRDDAKNAPPLIESQSTSEVLERGYKNARGEETCPPTVRIAVMMRTLLATCVALWALLALGAGAVNVPRKNPKVPPGFVTTSGSRFELDGKPFVSLGVCSLAVALTRTIL